MRQQEHVRTEIEMPTYTNEELSRFDVFLNKFRRDTPHKSIDMMEAATAFGAMHKRLNKGVYVYEIMMNVVPDSYGGIQSYEQPTRYALFNHKFNAWSKWKYAEQMKLEGYDEMAQQETPA